MSYNIIELPPNKTGKNAGLGRWKVQWRENGRQGSKVFYSQDEAKQFKTDKELGHVVSGRNTIEDLCKNFLEVRCPGRIAMRSLADYRQLCRNHIIPQIGNMRVDEVRYEHIEAVMTQALVTVLPRKKKPAGPRTANKLRVLFAQLFKHAIRLRWTRVNPARETDKMRENPRDGIAFEASEIDRLLNALESPYREPVLLAFFCGLRRGEILGLQWGDLSFPERKFRIERQRDGGRVWEPKTKAGKRKEFMSEIVEKMFRELAAKRAEVTKTDFVFLEGDQPMNGDRLLRQLRKALKRAGLREDFRLHDCRHTYATALGRCGTDIRMIQAKLGHTTSLMALKYQHEQDEASQQASEDAAAFLMRKKSVAQ